MNGVTVIRECTTTSYMGYIMMIIVIIITFVMSYGLMKIGEGLFNKTGNDFYGKAGAVLALSIFLSGTITSLKYVPEIDEFQKPTGKYKVVVNSDVDMNEFQSKYDIIDYNDGVYTVKPKDNISQSSSNFQEKTTYESTTEINGKVYKIIPIE